MKERRNDTGCQGYAVHEIHGLADILRFQFMVGIAHIFAECILAEITVMPA